MQGMGVSALFLGPWQACAILLDSTLSWQPCLILALLSHGRHACSILALPSHGRRAQLICVQHPLLKLPLGVTRKTKPGCHSVPGGYRHCQRGWSQPFTGHSGGRTYRGQRPWSPHRKLMTGGRPERWAGVGRAAEAANQPFRICFLISLL